MKVLEEAIMPNGIEIQLEDWGENSLSIGAYPLAKNTSKYKWIQGGEKFRLSIARNFKSNDEVVKTFNKLMSGEISLEQLADKFWDGNKDKWYLGMQVEYNGW